jgi:hypothetical protein
MLKFEVDPTYPHHVLDSCVSQIDMLVDLMCGDGGGDITLSERGAAGLCDNLRGVSCTLAEVRQRVHELMSGKRPPLRCV